jgi:tripartite ATP-independent transporter DctM subunit
MVFDPIYVGLFCVALFFILSLIGVKIAVSMLASGFLGLCLMNGPKAAVMILGTNVFSVVSSYDFAVLPMFILMAQIITVSEMGTDLYKTASAWLGHLRGGLALATIGACAVFAAVTAFPWAAILSIGAIAIPQMKKYKYSTELAIGSVAAGSELGDLIPPSAMFITYGMVTSTSIGTLLVAGVVPGIILMFLYMIVIAIGCKIKPAYGPRGPQTPIKDKIKSIKGSIGIIIVVVVVLGGMFAGAFTPTEAGSIGALGAFIIAVVKNRLSLKKMKEVLLTTAGTVGMIYFLITSANVLKQMIAVSTLPFWLSDLVAAFNMPPLLLMVIILVIYVILGCFVECMSMVLLTVGIFLPIVESCGFSAIWFGVIMVRMGDIGGLTPPMGMTAFFLKGLYKEVPLGRIFRSIGPFLIADFVHLALLLFFPAIAEWLPRVTGMMH